MWRPSNPRLTPLWLGKLPRPKQSLSSHNSNTSKDVYYHSNKPLSSHNSNTSKDVYYHSKKPPSPYTDGVKRKREITVLPHTDAARDSVSESAAQGVIAPAVVGASANPQQQYQQIHLRPERAIVKNMSDIIGIVEDLVVYVSSMNMTDTHHSNIPVVLDILGNITQNAVVLNLNFNAATLSHVVSIVSQLLNEGLLEPASRADSHLGPQLLESMENLFSQLVTVNTTFNLSFANIQLYCYTSSCSDLSKEDTREVTPQIELSLKGGSYPSSCRATFLSASFDKLGMAFPSQYEDVPNKAYKISSQIMTNHLSLARQSNHSANIKITFISNSSKCNETAICVFWNNTLRKWSSKGCMTQVNNNVVECICGHLTSYAVLMSISDSPIDSVNDTILNYITEVGLVISMISLVVCIALQVSLIHDAGSLMASYRHLALLNMSLCLLFSNISFFASSIINVRDQQVACFALTFCIHFSLLAFFCWTMVQTLFLVCRLVFVFHHVTKREFASLAVILGYACPIIIASATLLHYNPIKGYRKQDVCWLEGTSGAAYAFIIPTIIIMVGNFLGLVIVIRTLLRPSVSDGAREDEEVVKKLVKAVVFCTPQFGLTWAVGIPLLTNGNSLALQYLFVLLNPLQRRNHCGVGNDAAGLHRDLKTPRSNHASTIDSCVVIRLQQSPVPSIGTQAALGFNDIWNMK
ncbi:adhesion G-protein coupled receptor F1-like [Pleurodeles waltl]|uniref:adhesion G-protein coupled receptor F1-like n=1 Tax=Pleurodeles waltl TaxID=8319 RepID=UPI0037096E93